MQEMLERINYGKKNNTFDNQETRLDSAHLCVGSPGTAT